MDSVAKPESPEQSASEKRRSKLLRRKGIDRRQNINPNYMGPARRTTIDRRMSTRDRRKSEL